MASNKKPPLPNGISIASKRPELFCLNYNHTKKMCDDYNKKVDDENQKKWDDFHKKRKKSSN